MHAPSIIVLDTNVVLDWLVFDDPATRGVAEAIRSARLCWRVSESLRDELAHVLARGIKTVPALDAAGVWRQWAKWSTPGPEAPEGGATTPACSDPDDQKFIALAIACNARWLLSRDKAVLKLARAAKPLGLHIVEPRLWRAEG